jgi:Glycosyltransferase Family 4
MRVLFLSYTFPPDIAVGGLRIARLCRYLPECGIEPIVLTVEESFYEGVDRSVPLPEQLKIIRTSCISTPLDWYRKICTQGSSTSAMSGEASARANPAPSFSRQQILAMLTFPDQYWGWYLPALKAAARWIKQEKIEVLFSSGPPWICHVIGRRLKIRHRLPWIADFRDPWAHLLPKKREPRWFQRLSERLEDRCIASADMVICNTERLRQAFQKNYAATDSPRFRTLTNGFDDQLEVTGLHPGGTRVFLHLGSIYGLRRIDTFLQAIVALTHSRQLEAGSFQLLFQGEVSAEFVAQAETICPDLLRSGSLEFRPRVNWTEAQRVLAGADRLLLFQGNHELQVPAKFYEYLPTGLPIFAVSEPGALTDLLEATHSGLWVRPADSSEIARRFLEFLQVPRRTPESVKRELNRRFHFRHLASQLAEWMHGLLDDERNPEPRASGVTQ